MSGEMVTLLLGAQGGDEECFACLYAVTNPVLERYLRVVSDADPASLTLTTWSTLIEGISVCVADDDDDWLELAVGTARASALVSATIGSPVTPLPDRIPTVRAPADSDPNSDQVDKGVAALRACEPAVAEVLAMGVMAGLGRDSIARITGQEPIDVLALVLDGQTRLTLPLESLIATMQVPGTPAEIRDLPTILPLFAARSHALPTSPAAASEGKPTVVDLLTWDSVAPATSKVVLRRRAQVDLSPRWAGIGAGAAAWTIAVGGVAAAVAMIGVVPAAIHSLFGNGGNGG
ncbi:MAG TPA: hypothetical protein VGN19_09825, partial [Pedococcus sp.]|nr:hypothetical protein [Pedococcus sp.]